MRNQLIFFVLGLLFVQPGCQPKGPDIANLPVFASETLIHVVVSRPAGTLTTSYPESAISNKGLQEDTDSTTSVAVIPCPFNRGFIPGLTAFFPDDVLLLSEFAPAGSVFAALPVGILLYKVDQRMHQLLVAIPEGGKPDFSGVTSYAHLAVRYGFVKKMLEEWIGATLEPGTVELLGWRDERIARNLIVSDPAFSQAE